LLSTIGPPNSLTATAGSGSVTLSWAAPSYSGSKAVTGYNVYRGTTSGSETLVTNPGDVLMYQDTGMTPGTTYYYYVTTVTSVGESAKVYEVNAVPTAIAPGAPINLIASAGSAKITLSWSAPLNNGGATITKYNIYRGTTSGTETFITFVGGGVLTHVDTGLTNGQLYYYEVSATNSYGEGSKSNEASATPTAIVPGAPTSLAATASTGKIVLTWVAPTSNGGASITGYDIYRGTSAGAESSITTVGTVLTYTDTSVTGGTTYYYEVAAINSAGTGDQSNEVHATPTIVQGAPGAPTGLATSTTVSGQVTLTWTAPAIIGNSPISAYNIYRGKASGGETIIATIGNVLTYTDTSVTGGTMYYYTVAAINSQGTGAQSNEAVATPTATPPASDPFAQLIAWLAGIWAAILAFFGIVLVRRRNDSVNI